MRWMLCALLVAALVACEPPPEEEMQAPSMTREGVAVDPEGGQWTTHGGTPLEQRYSPLDQINADNVAQLGLAWSFDLGTTRGVEATPIVVDGRIFVTAPWSVLFALDARTGELLWKFDPKVPGAWGPTACCDVVNRGAAYWNGAVFVATIDGRLVSVDAATGSLNWEVQTTDRSLPYTVTGAPRVVKGKILIGNGGADMGVRGYVTAYDAESGRQIWRFYTVPGDPSKPFEHPELAMAAETWTGEWWAAGGGGTVWDSMAYDSELDLLYVGTGNGGPWTSYARSPGGGDNLFLCSILALRPDTGELVWHYQTTPGDNWDYTSVQHMILADLTTEGRTRRVLMQAPKNGFFYVLDRATGELISAEPYVSVNWASRVDPASGRPVETDNADYRDAPSLVIPAPHGGHNWHPMTFHPGTGLVYLSARDMAYWFVNDPAFDPSNRGKWALGQNMDEQIRLSELEPPDDPVGFLLAWDPVAQREVWRSGQSGYWNGGLLSTAGGLVFGGSADGLFRAFEAEKGEVLWEVLSQTGIMAPPVTYTVDGEQYVLVAAGWGGGAIAGPRVDEAIITRYRNEGRVLAFKLGGTAPMPENQPRETAAPAPPPVTASADELARGKSLYHRDCVLCHGFAVESALIVPDLRYLSPERHRQFDSIVLGGLFAARGMPSFAKELSVGEAALVHQYINEQAHKLYASQSNQAR